jgi:hypothetical protein
MYSSCCARAAQEAVDVEIVVVVDGADVVVVACVVVVVGWVVVVVGCIVVVVVGWEVVLVVVGWVVVVTLVPPLGTFDVPPMLFVVQPSPDVRTKADEVPKTETFRDTTDPHSVIAAAPFDDTSPAILDPSILTAPPGATTTPPLMTAPLMQTSSPAPTKTGPMTLPVSVRVQGMRSVRSILVANPSFWPPAKIFCRAVVVTGKSGESVRPTT